MLYRQPPLVPGARLGPYELVCPVASGGMGDVWTARDASARGSLVAIKVVARKYAGDPALDQMLADEARLTSRIRHANVARALAVGTEGGTRYLVFEWIDGFPLSRIMSALRARKARIPLPIALRLVCDVCAGLHAAHELRGPEGQLLGVVHRDVSPQNIMVDATGTAKVIDFGIAKSRDRSTEDTSTGIVKGKLRFLAPEQACGNDIDRRADVWAIGATLYWLVEDRFPVDAANDVDVLLKLAARCAVDPPRCASPHLASVLLRCLAPLRERRYASAIDVQMALEHVIAAERLQVRRAEIAAYFRRELSAIVEARNAKLRRALFEMGGFDPRSPTGAVAHDCAASTVAQSRWRPVVAGAVAGALVATIALAIAHVHRARNVSGWRAAAFGASVAVQRADPRVTPPHCER